MPIQKQYSAKFVKIVKVCSVIYLNLFFASCKLVDSSNADNIIDDDLLEKSSVSNENSPIVEIVQVQAKVFSTTLEVNGKTVANFDQTIVAELAGVIEACNIRNGQTVLIDSELIRFRDEELLLQLEKAKQLEKNKQLEYESILIDYKGLLTSKSGGEKERILDNIKVNSGLSTAKLNVEEAKRALGKSKIYAPISGMISDVFVQEGMYVNIGDELFKIYSNGQLHCNFDIPEFNLSQIEIGAQVLVRPLGGHRSYRGTIGEINPRVDNNGLVSVRIKLETATQLMPGMNVAATISSPKMDAIVVPKSAIVLRDNKPVLFTFKEGRAKWHDLTIGQENDNEVVIIKGVNVGDSVIVSNNVMLAHDSPVKLGS